MALSNHDQARIRQYLLGHLSDEEQQNIEERLMTEDDLFEELEISKGELIEEYCAGELSEPEHQWFEQHYLASPEGRQRHTFTLALNCLKRPIPHPKRVPWFDRLGFFFKTQPWAAATATAAVLVAVVGVVWLTYRPQTSLAVTLNSNLINRSSTGVRYPEIKLKPDVGEVRISLKLAESATPELKYGVELDNRQEIRKLNPTAQDANSVLVVIPARQLPPGLYSLRLIAVKDDGTEQNVPGDYFFEITN